MLYETDRLAVRRFTLADAPFVRALVTEPLWLAHIGSRDVETVADAERYLREGPLASYAAHGHGLYHVALKATGEPVGTCGLLRRPTLDAPDLGYAFLERYHGRGYATETARATLAHARALGLARVLAFTGADNAGSQRVLEKAGLQRSPTPGPDGSVLFEADLAGLGERDVEAGGAG